MCIRYQSKENWIAINKLPTPAFVRVAFLFLFRKMTSISTCTFREWLSKQGHNWEVPDHLKQKIFPGVSVVLRSFSSFLEMGFIVLQNIKGKCCLSPLIHSVCVTLFRHGVLNTYIQTFTIIEWKIV